MTELPYLLLGWLLGLLSPTIIDAIKSRYERRKLAVAIRSEAEDLQYRIATTSFLVAQRFGEVSKDYLFWLKPKVLEYRGIEPVESIRKLVDELLTAPEEQRLAMIVHLRAEEGMGLSLKQFSGSLIDSTLSTLQNFPVEYQRKIHEFRNQMNTLNQEIERVTELHRMTFDSSISSQNHERIKTDLMQRYKFIQGMCMRVSDRLQSVIEYDASKI